jgi:16S rRNA processing protein RimM
MGRIVGPFGVKGWLKLQPLTAAPRNLLGYGAWWVEGDAGWKRCAVEKAEVHGENVVAKFEGCDDRDEAARYRGLEVSVPRSEFPQAGENEFYWADLIGLKVVNEAGEDLGTVSRVFETGANDVLVVEAANENAGERLIPFVAEVVKAVDLAVRVIRVDWGSDY